MSLGSWFRDYVYIPLGGNRVSKAKWLRNICIVWFLTGFWHGADWNFILWGGYFAVFLVLEKVLGRKESAAKFAGNPSANSSGKYSAKHPDFKVLTSILGRIYVLLVVIVGFVIFNGTDMNQVIGDLGSMVGAGNLPMVSREFFYYFRSYGIILLIAIIGCTPVPKYLLQKVNATKKGAFVCNILEPVVLLAMMIVMTAYLVDGSFNPFLYFRF